MFAASKTAAAAAGTPPPSTDPQFNYVTMLLHGDGTNGAQNNTFVSEPVVVPSGVGYLAGQFSGSGQYLTTSSVTFAGDFTVEGWVFINNLSAARALVQIGDDLNANGPVFYVTTAGKFSIYAGSALLTGSATIVANTWVHLAVCRSGSTVKSYVNGVLDATITNSTSFTGVVRVGAEWYNGAVGGTLMNGYISNLRLVTGTAVYTSNFSVPTSPLTAISGTSLLTCQSGSGATFADNSTNNFTITRTGTPTMTGVATTPPGAVPYAGSFNGSSQYLSVANNAALSLGTGDFTIEAWVYLNATTDQTVVASLTNSSRGYGLQLNSTTITFLIFNGSSISGRIDFSGSISRDTWYHLAVSRNGTTTRLFLNGALVQTATLADQNAATTNPVFVGGQNFSGFPNYLNGYISNLRIVKGTAVYTSNFAPPASPLTAITNTSLLTCQSSTFIDNSPNNFTITNTGSTPVVSSYILPTITRNGTPTQGSFSPYGDLWSNQFKGTTDYLTVGGGMPSGQGTEFTLEFWAYSTTVGVNVFTEGPGANTLDFYVEATGTVKLDNTNVVNIFTTSAGVFPFNTWVHVALTRTTGNLYTLYINGVSVASGTNSTSYTANTTIGWQRSNTSFYFKGYLSNWRVTNTRVYTSNFTPSTTPLTAVSGTSLLTCQSNRFRDNSSNNFAITVTGTPSVQRFSPFDPAAEYGTSVIGGSAYFNGSSQYLTTSSVTFSGDFTVEGWVFINNLSAARALVQIGDDSTSTGPIFFVNTSGKFAVSAASNLFTGSITIAANTWVHLAVARSGSTIKSYVNGVLDSTITNSTTFTGAVRVGAEWYAGSLGSVIMNGYISNLRLVTGTALYTANFTPPTAPLTAITNTSLLLNCVNAGIFDNAMMNDLVTVGDAKISTAVKKYGTGSMAFDGTGDYLTTLNSQNCNFGTGDFTVETWVYTTATASGSGVTTASQYIIDARTAATTNAFILGFRLLGTGTGNLLGWYTGTTLLESSAVSINQWHHVAYTRSGTTGRLFLNGVQVATQTDSTNYVSGATITYGSRYTAENFLFGYIDDLRITKGIARYTANFTPPTAAFPNN